MERDIYSERKYMRIYRLFEWIILLPMRIYFLLQNDRQTYKAIVKSMESAREEIISNAS